MGGGEYLFYLHRRLPLKYLLSRSLKKIRKVLLVFGYLSKSNFGGVKGTEDYRSGLKSERKMRK